MILGAGFIGLEFAQALRRFGSQVVIVDRNDRILHNEDPDVSAELQRLLSAEGVEFVLNAEIDSVEGVSGDKVELRCSSGSSPLTITATYLLAATGRRPNTAGIGLEEIAGVTLDEHGYIVVNDQLKTSAADVYAVGECNGGPQFTHVAFDDFRVVRDAILGGNHTTQGRKVPCCLFTDPEFARIGLTETDAKAAHIGYRKFQIPMRMMLRTRTLSETNGFAKALVAVNSDEILGFSCVGHGAGELLATVQVAIMSKLPYTALRDMMFTHPTLNEGLIALFSSAPTETL